MIATRPDADAIWAWLSEVADPEIPAISIVDLGIVRDIGWVEGDGGVLKVTVTPTYSGCPATRVIEREIVRTLNGRGIERLELVVRLAPPWTTAWMSEAGREKLRRYGIAPPQPARRTSWTSSASLTQQLSVRVANPPASN